MRYLVNGELAELESASDVKVSQGQDRLIVQTDDGVSSALAIRQGDSVYVSFEGQVYEVTKPSAARMKAGSNATGDAKAPMPGLVVEVFVEQGERVLMGQKLLVLEAMKMQHAVTAPFNGVVTAMPVTKGLQVTEGQLLVHVEAVDD